MTLRFLNSLGLKYPSVVTTNNFASTTPIKRSNEFEAFILVSFNDTAATGYHCYVYANLFPQCSFNSSTIKNWRLKGIHVKIMSQDSISAQNDARYRVF